MNSTNHLRGEAHGRARLTESQVLVIRELYSTGEADQYELATEYEVTRANIEAIVRGRSWAHIGGQITKRPMGYQIPTT